MVALKYNKQEHVDMTQVLVQKWIWDHMLAWLWKMRWVPCLDWVDINQLDEVCVYVYSKGTLCVCVCVCVWERERETENWGWVKSYFMALSAVAGRICIGSLVKLLCLYTTTVLFKCYCFSAVITLCHMMIQKSFYADLELLKLKFKLNFVCWN